MANAHRGEIDARLNGTTYRLVLTLGALAELETAFGHEDMLALADRFSTGRLSARDASRIIGAGLRGAGHDVSDDAVLSMQADAGAAGYIDIVARLLAATFSISPTPSAQPRSPPATPSLGIMARAELDPPVGHFALASPAPHRQANACEAKTVGEGHSTDVEKTRRGGGALSTTASSHTTAPFHGPR